MYEIVFRSWYEIVFRVGHGTRWSLGFANGIWLRIGLAMVLGVLIMDHAYLFIVPARHHGWSWYMPMFGVGYVVGLY